METRTDAIALHEGYVTEYIDELIEACMIDDKVHRASRMAMYGSNFVVEYTADCEYRWSTGEKLLWDLFTSLSGRGGVCLGQLAGHFRGTDEWPLILKAIGAL